MCFIYVFRVPFRVPLVKSCLQLRPYKYIELLLLVKGILIGILNFWIGVYRGFIFRFEPVYPSKNREVLLYLVLSSFLDDNMWYLTSLNVGLLRNRNLKVQPIIRFLEGLKVDIHGKREKSRVSILTRILYLKWYKYSWKPQKSLQLTSVNLT